MLTRKTKAAAAMRRAGGDFISMCTSSEAGEANNFHCYETPAPPTT